MQFDEFIAWCCGIMVCIVFIILNRRQLNITGKVILPLIIYVSGIATGIFSGIELDAGNLLSASIAGIFAPLTYSTIFSLILFHGKHTILKPFRKKTSRNEDRSVIDSPFEDI